MAEQQQQTPVLVMQAEQKKSKANTIVSIILIIVLVTLSFYGYSWVTSDVGKQKLSSLWSSVSTTYNPFAWYGEQLKGAKEVGSVWETKPPNATAEKTGIKFQSFETTGNKIVPSGTPIAFRYNLDVGEGVNNIPVTLSCAIKGKDDKSLKEEEIIEEGSKEYIPDATPYVSYEDPLSYSNIVCQANTKQSPKDRIITAEGKISFPFSQRGSLKVYFTKDPTYTGKKFFEKHQLKETLPIKATYNNEPVELGLGVSKENTQPVIAGIPRYASQIGISLKNRWDGRVTKVTELDIILPKGVDINRKTSPPSLKCPFGESKVMKEKYTRYSAEPKYLEQVPVFGKGIGETLETYYSFECWLDIDESVLEGNPYIDKEYSASVKYEYEFQPKTETMTLKGTVEAGYEKGLGQ